MTEPNRVFITEPILESNRTEYSYVLQGSLYQSNEQMKCLDIDK